MGAPYQLVELAGPAWTSGPLVVARTRRDRLAGIRRLPDGVGVLLRARSVWAPAGSPPLWSIAVDRHGMVGGVTLLRPGGLVADRHAVWIAEIAGDRPPPLPGWALRVEAWRER